MKAEQGTNGNVYVVDCIDEAKSGLAIIDEKGNLKGQYDGDDYLQYSFPVSGFAALPKGSVECAEGTGSLPL